MTVWRSLITRYRIHINTGALVAEGLYRLRTTCFLDPCDQHSLIPRGTLVFGCDMNPDAQCQDGDVWLACADFCQAYHYALGDCSLFTEKSPVYACGSGCCGLSGGDNLYDAATDQPIGDLFTDCYGPHYVKLKAGQYRLEREENSIAVTLVGFVNFEHQSWLVGCASGRNFDEVEARLYEACERTIRTEAGHAFFMGLSLETLRVRPELADQFLRSLDGRPIQWLFLKNRSKLDNYVSEYYARYVGNRRFVPFSEVDQVDQQQLEAEEMVRRAEFGQNIKKIASRMGRTATR